VDSLCNRVDKSKDRGDLLEKTLIDPSQRGAAVTTETRAAAIAVMESVSLTMFERLSELELRLRRGGWCGGVKKMVDSFLWFL
jgi:hypothetical protein